MVIETYREWCADVENKTRAGEKSDSKHFGEIMELVAKHDAISEIIFRVPYPEAGLFDRYSTSGVLFAKHTLLFMAT